MDFILYFLAALAAAFAIVWIALDMRIIRRLRRELENANLELHDALRERDTLRSYSDQENRKLSDMSDQCRECSMKLQHSQAALSRIRRYVREMAEKVDA